jgi:long-chain fatty acid transport protein
LTRRRIAIAVPLSRGATMPKQSLRHPAVAVKAVMSALVAVAAASAQLATAGGISLYEFGTPDVGLAAAGFAARAQDAATVYTNPAGITRLSGNHVTGGVQALYGFQEFSIGSGTTPALGSGDGGRPIGWVPGGGAFYSHSVSSDFKVGIAVTGDFGSAVKYDSDWVGRYFVQEAKLLGASIVPSAAWRIDPQWSVGAGINFMYGMLENKVAVNNLVGGDGRLSIDDNAWGYGVRLGVLYEPTPATRVGVTYNSQIKLDFRASPEWSGVGPLLSALLRSRGLFDTSVDLGVRVPQGVMASAYHEVDPRWAILGSVGWQDWSRFGRVDVSVDSSNPINLTTALDYKDTWHVSAGAQRRLNEAWRLNFGVGYDSRFQQNGAVALAMPSNAAWRFAVGTQYRLGKDADWGVSLSYVVQDDLEANRSGPVPVALGGRGTVTGSYDNPRVLFLATHINWRF